MCWLRGGVCIYVSSTAFFSLLSFKSHAHTRCSAHCYCCGFAVAVVVVVAAIFFLRWLQTSTVHFILLPVCVPCMCVLRWNEPRPLFPHHIRTTKAHVECTHVRVCVCKDTGANCWKIRDRWRAHIQKSYGNIIAALAVAAATGIAVAAASTEMPHIAAVRKSLSRKLISQILTTNKSQICNFYHMENEKTEFSSRQFVFNFTFKRESYRLHIIEYPN